MSYRSHQTSILLAPRRVIRPALRRVAFLPSCPELARPYSFDASPCERFQGSAEQNPFNWAQREKARGAIEARDRAEPSSPFLTDRFSRQHTYLRVSLTEKCNFRCLYCMPAEGVQVTPKERLLSAVELERLTRLFVQEGVQKIRLTGGEPTVRKDLPEIVAALSDLRSSGLRQIGMTTNGLTLSRHLPHLVKNGLTHLNVSLDTLDPLKFELMTRTPAKGIEKVLDGINTALALGVENVKINVVVIRGLNDGKDILDFVEWAKDKSLTIRFIEYMPFDGNRWRPEKLVPYSQLLSRITERFGAMDKVVDDANDTSKHWKVPGHTSTLGFITSMTEHFCGTCNRLRITADGNLKVCLFGNSEVSLRDAMRIGLPESGSGPASDKELLRVIGAAVQRKHARHAGMADPVELANGRISHGLQKRTWRKWIRSPMSSILGRSQIQARAFSYARRRASGDSYAPADDASTRKDVNSLRKDYCSSGGVQKWSDYMGSTEEGDSPWASLDAIADGFNSTSSNHDAEKVTKAPESKKVALSSHDGFEAAAAAAAEAFASSKMQLDRLQTAVGTRRGSQLEPTLTHLDPEDNSRAAMVDVSDKGATKRTATARCRVYIPDRVLALLERDTPTDTSVSIARRKGPVLHTAQLAGIMAAKRTSELIPLCHGLNLSHVDVQLKVIQTQAAIDQVSDEIHAGGFAPEALQDWDAANSAGPGVATSNSGPCMHFIEVACTATTISSTGVEMEALTGASVASLTLWDMLKSVGGTAMRIDGLMVTRKTGGKSGDFEREGAA